MSMIYILNNFFFLFADGPFTLFAPTDTAFDQFPPYLLIKLVSDDKKLTGKCIYDHLHILHTFGYEYMIHSN